MRIMKARPALRELLQFHNFIAAFSAQNIANILLVMDFFAEMGPTVLKSVVFLLHCTI